MLLQETFFMGLECLPIAFMMSGHTLYHFLEILSVYCLTTHEDPFGRLCHFFFWLHSSTTQTLTTHVQETHTRKTILLRASSNITYTSTPCSFGLVWLISRIFSANEQYFSHTKSANGTFSHNLLAKQTQSNRALLRQFLESP